MKKQALEELLNGSQMAGSGSLLSERVRLSVEKTVQELLEAEQDEYLGRGRYERGGAPGVLCAESYEACMDFLRGMIKRGLRMPLTVTTDGAAGLIKAVRPSGPKPNGYVVGSIKCRTFNAKYPISA
ncbi:MAG: hypothetical protein KJ626_04525 [Verrucomicrobia bacterium]|nr:hypothetical protein [Verrucomicrobiota bacterium]